ncbi:MAG: hypothetical protein ABSD88_17910, partial [Candidatus Korobacteraceae bacterium]
MPLFDDIRHIEMRPRRQNEGVFEYMNTSARPGICRIRELLERWFEHLPANAKADVGSRFRTRDGHEGAFFELYWHELLLSNCYKVELHPTIADGANKPDFLVYRNDVPQFYLEATLAMPQGNLAADRRFAELHDTLDRMNSPDYF